MADIFIIGDPVVVRGAVKNTLGKVVAIQNCVAEGNLSAEFAIFVKLIGRTDQVMYFPGELEICKCVTRTPKGITRCAAYMN